MCGGAWVGGSEGWELRDAEGGWFWREEARRGAKRREGVRHCAATQSDTRKHAVPVYGSASPPSHG
jgi:hypothetical protein